MIYFAYGSNLDPEQMAMRCPGHRVIGKAMLADHRLCFPRHSPVRGCGVASVQQNTGTVVWGVLYELDDRDLAVLDRMEGYDPSDKTGSRYIRTTISVMAEGDHDVAAQAYFAVADDSGALPSSAYMRHILDGARHHGFPADYLVMLEAQALMRSSPGTSLPST